MTSMLLVTGETSGDEHSAPVVRAIKDDFPNLVVFGMGGRELLSAGMELTVDARESASVMGFTEVLGKLGALRRAFYALLAEVDRRETKVALLVDFPDFNLRLAKQLHKRGVKVIYFITPQLWAWRKYRIKQVQAYVEKVLPIIPFEEPFYREHGVPVRYVGHPFLDKKRSTCTSSKLREELKISNEGSLLALLPGSRVAEIKSLMPIYLEAFALLKKKNPDLKAILPMAHSVIGLFSDYKIPADMHLIEGRADDVLSACDLGIVASGTATVEAALYGLPFCIAYKLSALTYAIGRILVRNISFIGMPNLIAGREVAREFLQTNCTAENLYKEIDKILNDKPYRDGIIEGLKVTKLMLQNGSDGSTNLEEGAMGDNSVAKNVCEELRPYLSLSES